MGQLQALIFKAVVVCNAYHIANFKVGVRKEVIMMKWCIPELRHLNPSLRMIFNSGYRMYPFACTAVCNTGGGGECNNLGC